MTKILAIATLCVAGSILPSCASPAEAPEACCGACAAVPDGLVTAVNDKTSAALAAALQDERRARAFYEAVMAKHGRVRPFAMIVRAEERHEAVVTALMERHSVAVPGPNVGELPPVPATLRECNSLAAKLERENIAMYDRLFADVTEPDITAAFKNLQAASRDNHLSAFERWAR